MDPSGGEVTKLNYRELFPWVQLFRTFEIALSTQKLLLGALAVLLIILGTRAMAWLPFVPQEERDAIWQQPWPWEPTPHQISPSEPTHNLPPGIFHSELPSSVLPLAYPLISVHEPLGVIFDFRDTRWSDLAMAWSRFFWITAVWAIIGGALTRMAALQFAQDERIGMGKALGFSLKRFFSYYSAPLLPLLGLGAFSLLIYLGGLLGRIPGAGDFIVGTLWFLALLLSFVMALILIGLLAGWPLMYPTISTEGSDAFDGFSRSYGFVYNLPWRLILYTLIVLIYGGLVYAFVSLVADWMLGFSAERIASAMQLEPPAQAQLAGLPGMPENQQTPLLSIVKFWTAGVYLLLYGFAVSFFWSASTVIYFLLRQADDATDLEEVFVPDNDSRDHLIPLAGVQAMQDEVPIMERPPGHIPPLEPPDPRALK